MAKSAVRDGIGVKVKWERHGNEKTTLWFIPTDLLVHGVKFTIKAIEHRIPVVVIKDARRFHPAS
jgi:hypothetical protein